MGRCAIGRLAQHLLPEELRLLGSCHPPEIVGQIPDEQLDRFRPDSAFGERPCIDRGEAGSSRQVPYELGKESGRGFAVREIDRVAVVWLDSVAECAVKEADSLRSRLSRFWRAVLVRMFGTSPFDSIRALVRSAHHLQVPAKYWTSMPWATPPPGENDRLRSKGGKVPKVGSSTRYFCPDVWEATLLNGWGSFGSKVETKALSDTEWPSATFIFMEARMLLTGKYRA